METLDEMISDKETYEKNDVKSNVEKLELYSDNYPFNLPLRITTFEDESLYTKFIKNIEKSIRGSIEYKLWTDYIKDVLGVQTCFITHERMDQVKIDIHHHIPSLYTVVKGALNKRIQDNIEFCSFDIATDVIELHYKNRIGYVSLLKSIHEKFHNGFLRIPVDLVKGDYQWFIREYSEYLDQEDLDIINERLSITEGNNTWEAENYPGIKASEG